MRVMMKLTQNCEINSDFILKISFLFKIFNQSVYKILKYRRSINFLVNTIFFVSKISTKFMLDIKKSNVFEIIRRYFFLSDVIDLIFN